MKAQDVFDAIDQLKPNDFNRSEKRGWLKQLEQMILREIIIPHGGTVEDVANIATFLASDMSSYVSGQVIQVDGGMNM